MPAIVPTGAQHLLRHGDHEAVVVEVGAGLRTYRFAGRDVVEGYAQDEPCSAGRGQTLIPWPNRVAGARYRFDDVEHTLIPTEAATGHAIHGLTRWANWTLTARTEASARLEHTVHAHPGWPFVLHCAIDYTLDDTGLRVCTSATNRGATRCPYATGAHPYLTVGTPTVDNAQLTLRADTRYDTDPTGIPTGPVAHHGWDPMIGDREIDTAFTGLRRDPDGLARTTLTGPDGHAVTLWQDGAYGWLQVFTGHTLAAPRHRTGLAVEPMTAPPNALRTGLGLVVLDPGRTHVARWGLTAH